MHWLLFIHKILFSSTCFEPQVLIFRGIQLYTCSIWYCHSLWEFLVACRYTAWVRKLVINIWSIHDARSEKHQVIDVSVCSLFLPGFGSAVHYSLGSVVLYYAHTYAVLNHDTNRPTVRYFYICTSNTALFTLCLPSSLSSSLSLFLFPLLIVHFLPFIPGLSVLSVPALPLSLALISWARFCRLYEIFIGTHSSLLTSPWN